MWVRRRCAASAKRVAGRDCTDRVLASGPATMDAAGAMLMRIIPAIAAELPAVGRLADEIWREYYPGIVPLAQIDYMLERGYSVEALGKFIRDEGAGLALLMAGDSPVGFAAWHRFGEPATTKLDKLYLHASVRGRGAGRMLIEHVEREARRDGSRKLTLRVNKDNAKSIAAYRACGLAVVRHDAVDIGSGFVMDDFIMEKTL